MQLFLFGTNLSADQMDHAEACMQKMETVFTTLSMDTYWAHRVDGRTLLATVNHPLEATGNRCYRYADDHQITMYDGVFVDPTGVLSPNQATVLAQDWDGVQGRIEGQFMAAKLDKATGSFELFCDHMGFYHLFICEHEGGWLVSNSIRLLTRVRRRFAIDPVGIGMTISYGITFGDRTLQEGIRVLPGGHLISFDGENGHFQKRPYFDRVKWSRKRPFRDLDIERLADRLARPLRQLADTYGPLEAPITAGQDSRVMLALLRSEDADAIYFSSGRKDLLDVTTGQALANHFNLPHRWIDLIDKGLIEKWEALTDRLMLETDGAMTLAHVGSLYNQPRKLLNLPVHLYGAGGEFGKGLYVDLDFYMAKQSAGRLVDYLIKLNEKKKKAFANESACKLGRASLRRYVLRMAREGFKNADLLMAYFAFVRFPRWAGANIKSVAPYADVYAPLCTRTFAEAAFSIHPIRRYCHSLHYQLIKHCLPELQGLPIEHCFRTQRADKNTIKLIRSGVKSKLESLLGKAKKNALRLPKVKSREHQRMKWLYENMGQMRQKCLDQPQSLIWDFIKRDEFEKATSASADIAYAGHHQRELFQLFTLFSYEASAD